MSECVRRSIHPYLLSEGMAGPHDLPSHAYVRIWHPSPSKLIVSITDETGRRIEDPNGRVAAQRRGAVYDAAYEIVMSIATPGWGPMMYDIAMEEASVLGGGLMSDRGHVSNAAASVWRSYLNRRVGIDVVAHPIMPKENEAPPNLKIADIMNEDSLRYRYTKEMAVIPRLEQLGKLIRKYEGR